MAKNNTEVPAQLLVKVAGYPAKEVRTSMPVTLNDAMTGKMIAYSNTNETRLIPEYNKSRIVQAWNGWRTDNYEVVWDGAQKKGLSSSNLPNQKGLLIGDYAGGSGTKQIMDHMAMSDIDEVVDPTKHSKKKKKGKSL